MSWTDYAACRAHDPELFFPIGTTAPALAQLDEAKAVCHGCAVRCVCLEWAVLAGVDHGVWGGLSEDERRMSRRRQLARPNPAGAPLSAPLSETATETAA